MSFYQRVLASLEKDKENYKYVFLDVRNNNIKLVKSRWRLMPQKRFYVSFADEELFGKEIPESRTKNWHLIGML